jgi:hypothetical protein
MASAPVVAAMHDRFPEAIEEEVELLYLHLAAYVLEWHARVPDWHDYHLGLDQTRRYPYLKKVLHGGWRVSVNTTGSNDSTTDADIATMNPVDLEDRITRIRRHKPPDSFATKRG